MTLERLLKFLSLALETHWGASGISSWYRTVRTSPVAHTSPPWARGWAAFVTACRPAHL